MAFATLDPRNKSAIWHVSQIKATHKRKERVWRYLMLAKERTQTMKIEKTKPLAAEFQEKKDFCEGENEAAVDALEARNWRVDFNENGSTFLEWYSPVGEDYCIESDSNDLLKIFEQEREFFDVDDHVDLWAKSRGKRGVPSSYAVLVDDAKAIEKELEECEREVRNVLSLQGK